MRNYLLGCVAILSCTAALLVHLKSHYDGYLHRPITEHKNSLLSANIGESSNQFAPISHLSEHELFQHNVSGDHSHTFLATGATVEKSMELINPLTLEDELWSMSLQSDMTYSIIEVSNVHPLNTIEL